MIEFLREKCRDVVVEAEANYLQGKWTHDKLHGEHILSAHALTLDICERLCQQPDNHETIISSLKENNSYLKSAINDKLLVLKHLQEKSDVQLG